MDAVRMATDNDAVIEGWAVPFDGHLAGGRDSYQTRFSARTDYRLDWYRERPLLYNHGVLPEPGLTPVGHIRSLDVRDKGVWMQAELDRQSEYFSAIREMVQAGKLFLSSASVEHLVQIDTRSGDVTRWPIVEVSLTPTPANLLATIPVTRFRAATGVELPGEVADDDAIVHVPVRVDAGTGDAGATPDTPDVPATSLRERSFEDIRQDISDLLNPPVLYGPPPAWHTVVATFADHVIVCRMEAGDDDTYWRIPYALGDDLEPRLGVAEPVQQAYVPAALRTATAPLTLLASHLERHAAALVQHTQGLDARRYREGRMLSASNMQTISAIADGLEAHAQALRDLHQRAQARHDEAARAASFADPAYVAMRLRLLELSTV